MSLDRTLVCPGCRTRTAGRLDVRTLDRDGDTLRCSCGRSYPIVDGVPVVLPDAAPIVEAAEGDLALDVASLLEPDLPDDAPYPRLAEHLSTYLDAHWGDRAEPALAPAMRAISDKLTALPRVAAAVELGCSAGRVVAELCARADHVVGIELQLATARRARRILDGESLAYGRRMAGRHYATAVIAAAAVPADRRMIVCGDALDPPLIPAVYDRVVALNMIDSVARPRGLLSVVDGLCRPGGEVILSSPYSWQSSVMHDHERIGGADPAAELERMLTAGEGLGAPYVVEDRAELPWVLRRDARSSVAYQIHYLRARKT